MTPHYQDDSIKIYKLRCAPYDNNAYLIVCPMTNHSIIIDAPAHPRKLIECAMTTKVDAILITHNHLDHLHGLTEIVSAFNAPVGIGNPDADAMTEPPDFLLEDGSEMHAGALTLEVITTPGHTPGSSCLRIGPHLFTGDTLFPGGPGKTKSPENLRQIIESITLKLFPLGNDVIFYPGHGHDGDLKTAKAEYVSYASKPHPVNLCGDVRWLNNQKGFDGM